MQIKRFSLIELKHVIVFRHQRIYIYISIRVDILRKKSARRFEINIRRISFPRAKMKAGVDALRSRYRDTSSRKIRAAN